MSTANEIPPTARDVQRIGDMTDPVGRNRQITRCYYDLSQGLARWLPGGANWCTVATWASRQAGQSIRREDLRRALERLLRDSREVETAARELESAAGNEGPESLLGAAVAIRDALSPAAAFERTAEAVARGNRKVFVEIGLEFARFLALFEGGSPNDAALAVFLNELRPGGPPEGQGRLRDAFSHYHAALRATGQERAELMLLANLEIGFHEQTRLQPEIRAAMDAPVYEPGELRRRLLNEVFPDPAARLRLAIMRLGGEAAPLLAARDRLADEAQRLGRLVITDALMTLELPGGRVIRLGRDLLDDYPALLRDPVNADLRALLNRVEAATSTPGRDWSELPYRMRFIARLFRAHHEDQALFQPPLP